MRIMRQASLFIHGGGNIIQDSTSTRSLFFYLAPTLIAKHLGMRVMFFGNGFGPLIKPFNRRVSGRVLNQADAITVREKLSLGELESLSVKKPLIRLTADPALLVTEIAPEHIINEIFINEDIPYGHRYVGFSVREYQVASSKTRYGGEEYLGAIARAADDFCTEHEVLPVFLPTEYPRDVRQIEKVLRLMKTKGYIIRQRYGITQTLGIVAGMEMMVAMRLHALIFAANLGVPVVSIEYQPKIAGFIDYIEQPSAGRVEDLKYESLRMLMDKIWDDRVAIRNHLNAIMTGLREKALDNVYIAAKLLDDYERA
jgi:polysaccharide pyruvyl transferase CsaB